MPGYVALLRAVNVGGASTIRMEALSALLTQLGFRGVRTLLQSGNVVFEAGSQGAEALERQLERAVETKLGVRTDVLVRSSSEWDSIIARNPFPNQAREEPSRLVVTALKEPPQDTGWRALRTAIRGPEVTAGAGREAYIVYPNGQGRSKLTINVIERALGTRGTSRNWNTVLRVREALGG